MYQDRKFDSWKNGLIYLIIEILMPIIPIIIYITTNKNYNNYLYVLLLTVIISFFYEVAQSNNNCSKFLKIENIICLSFLGIMFVMNLFMLIYYSEVEKSAFGIWDYILISMFLIPIIATIVEIVRAVIVFLQTNEYRTNGNNLVAGASTV